MKFCFALVIAWMKAQLPEQKEGLLKPNPSQLMKMPQRNKLHNTLACAVLIQYYVDHYKKQISNG